MQKKINLPKFIIVITIILLIGTLFGTVGYFINNYQKLENQSEIQQVDSKKLSDDKISDNFKNETNVSDWKNYRHEEYGFEMKYPNDWLIEEGEGQMMSENYIDFIKIIPKQERILSEDFNGNKLVYPGIYIYKSERDWESEIDDFNFRLEGASIDININGINGVKKEGEITEHIPVYGSKKIEAVLDWNNIPYIISAFDYDKEIFNQVLSTFKFIEKDEILLLYKYDWGDENCSSFFKKGFGSSASYKKDCSKWIDFNNESVYYKFDKNENLEDYFCEKNKGIHSGYYYDSLSYPTSLYCRVVKSNGRENVFRGGYYCNRAPCGPVMCGDLPNIESCEFRDVLIAYSNNIEYPIVVIGHNWGNDCISKKEIEEINRLDFSFEYEELDILMQKKYEECKIKNEEIINEFYNYIENFELYKR